MNYIKTFMLLGALTALFGLLGYGIAGTSGLVIALIMSGLMNMYAYWFSSTMAIRAARAQEAEPARYSALIREVEDLSNRMEIPVPKVYISPATQPNAFATGRNPKNAAVCFTSGIMESLDREELRGVIAHELAHIKNRDILISSVAATLAGAISSIGNILFFTGGIGGNDEGRGNPLLGLVGIIIAPFAAFIIQMAISRTREYAADKAAAEATGNPDGLANALTKIQQLAQRRPMKINEAYASLYISSPLGKVGFFKEMFSTHPPTDKRIDALMSFKR